MNFAYIDESGSPGKRGVFTMAGILVDATALRRWTMQLNTLFNNMLKRNTLNSPAEIKAADFIAGRDGWKYCVPASERRAFLHDVCHKVIKCGTIYAYGMSLERFNKEAEELDRAGKFPKPIDHPWIAVAMFITCLIQKQVQELPHGTGMSVLVFDEHTSILKLSRKILSPEPWYDGLYAKFTDGDWETPQDRLDQIPPSGLTVDSKRSVFIQIADILSYIYRNHLELAGGRKESFTGEQDYYRRMVTALGHKRARLGECQPSLVVDFYKKVKHPQWKV